MEGEFASPDNQLAQRPRSQSPRSARQLATEKNIDYGCLWRSRCVRAITVALFAAFTLCSLANVVLTILTLFMTIPYLSVKRVSSLLEIGLLLVPRLVMLFATFFCSLIF